MNKLPVSDIRKVNITNKFYHLLVNSTICYHYFHTGIHKTYRITMLTMKKAITVHVTLKYPRTAWWRILLMPPVVTRWPQMDASSKCSHLIAILVQIWELLWNNMVPSGIERKLKSTDDICCILKAIIRMT